MQLDKRWLLVDRLEVRAVAKSRVNRTEGKKMNYYYIGVLLGMMVGFFLCRINLIGGACVMAIAVMLMFYAQRKISAKYNQMEHEVMKEWAEDK